MTVVADPLGKGEGADRKLRGDDRLVQQQGAEGQVLQVVLKSVVIVRLERQRPGFLETAPGDSGVAGHELHEAEALEGARGAVTVACCSKMVKGLTELSTSPVRVVVSGDPGSGGYCPSHEVGVPARPGGADFLVEDGAGGGVVAALVEDGSEQMEATDNQPVVARRSRNGDRLFEAVAGGRKGAEIEEHRPGGVECRRPNSARLVWTGHLQRRLQ